MILKEPLLQSNHNSHNKIDGHRIIHSDRAFKTNKQRYVSLHLMRYQYQDMIEQWFPTSFSMRQPLLKVIQPMLPGLNQTNFYSSLIVCTLF